MVTTWILNSIPKEIVEAFMYTKSSRNLWLDLEQRYGECNGPQLYQLQREICSMTQGETDMAAFTQLMQFLMGLSDVFDSVRHQLLVMDPVPSINKAYAMVQSVEKQRQVHMELSESTENVALHYKELQDKRRRDTIPARGFTVDANPMKEVHSETKGELLQELIRLMKTGFQMDSPQGNFAQSDDFAGMNGVFAGYGNNILTSWIVDTGATNHMCASACILTNVSPLPNPTSVHLPDGNTQLGHPSSIVLQHIPEIKHLNETQTNDCCICPLAKATQVFKLKLNPDGSVERYKARLVAKGYNQIERVDYFDNFSLVAKSVTVRIFLALAVSRSWPLLQFDVNNTFLHGFLDEDVYMEPPQGFIGATPGQVCKLQKSLYGLKQASRQWNLELTTKFLNFGFSQSTHENYLFIKSSDSEFTALLVYVDDILLTGNSESALHAVRDYLDDLFTIKDLGQAKYFLGLELARSSHGLQVSQHKYLQDILADTSMLAAKPASTPFPLGLKLILEDGALLPDPNKYRRLIGRLLYLGFTRPDISFAVQQLSQFLQASPTSHWDAALHVLRYLKGTPSTGLFFSSASSSQLTAYSDAS
ncbi:UNVERIFIED_CONTAM: Retrovirus-related Pol polyprotein from transposon RE1 [Sesamum radiatum]|uniref:Retrovirus-related Pol polyprotein from transposon RE1 n=1 Tax=Sesamum radiatum TaxID=300843 RepID=A0AAW2S5X4_SESRA